MAFNIVLVEPEIPQNTGNIVRTCAATGSTLHLVRPLGFAIDDKRLKRAGLDYWHLVDIRYYDSFDDVRAAYAGSCFYFATTKGKKFYNRVQYRQGDFLVFGKETKGLPKEIIEQNAESCIRIPMVKETAARSINLSNAVAVVLYEALRQQDFTDLT
jgi:tRNA (cytidine/uridine-2'-O-)-methyltransferase